MGADYTFKMINSHTLFSYHLIRLNYWDSIRFMLFPIHSKNVNGLIHADIMSAMKLGSSIFHINRLMNREIAVFAQWENQAALDDFLSNHSFGKQLKKSWYLVLQFTRQWGSISDYQIPTNTNSTTKEDDLVVAVTLAKMRYSQIPRFLRWGRPVEKQVRDDQASRLSLASIRYPNLISTFSIWNTQLDMTNMVRGHSKTEQPTRHRDAMRERNRKDFHFEFTTLRFVPLEEHGSWKGKSNYTK